VNGLNGFPSSIPWLKAVGLFFEVAFKKAWICVLFSFRPLVMHAFLNALAVYSDGASAGSGSLRVSVNAWLCFRRGGKTEMQEVRGDVGGVL